MQLSHGDAAAALQVVQQQQPAAAGATNSGPHVEEGRRTSRQRGLRGQGSADSSLAAGAAGTAAGHLSGLAGEPGVQVPSRK